MRNAGAKVAVILIILVAVVIMVEYNVESVHFWEFKSEDVTRLFTQLILVALIIERALEVVLTPWRGPETERRATSVQHFDRLAKAPGQAPSPQAQEELEQSKVELIDFKTKTQQIAFKASFVLGVIVSLVGIRTLSPLVEPNAFSKLPNFQQVSFNALDVFLTGALLSGGADGLHQILSLFLDYVGKTRDGLQRGAS